MTKPSARRRIFSILLAGLAACGEPGDTSAESTEAPGPSLVIQALTAEDFENGVAADGIVVSLHGCQPVPLRCEPVGWAVVEGQLIQFSPYSDFRLVWLR